DRGQRARLGQERQGERAFARADLDEAVARRRRERAKDAIDHAALVQEMLAEALARDVRAFHQRPACASFWASSTAARRLPRSAPPVPARSSATPWSTEVRT